MDGSAANSRIEGAKYIYIYFVGGVPVVAAVLTPKYGPFGIPPKN